MYWDATVQTTHETVLAESRSIQTKTLKRHDSFHQEFLHAAPRKFRTQTSDNMQRWKSRDGKSQGGEVKKWEDQRRERVGSKKMQVREKVGKSWFTVFFQWFGAPEGQRVTSLKRRVRSQLARWKMKNCTPFLARSTSVSRKTKNTSRSDHFWKLRCRKSARRCGAKHISKSKCAKHHMFGPLLEVAMSKKRTPLWRKAHFQVQSVKKWGLCSYAPFLTFRYGKSGHWLT